MKSVMIRKLGLQPYVPMWLSMQRFTMERTPETPDEIWAVEHPPVFTQGLNGKPEHLLAPAPIPVVAVDRGGQVTYHGPGQVVIYPLLDLRRLLWGVRDLVCALEQTVIDMLQNYGIQANNRPAAPGVYVGERKIASLGLRIRRGCCYHGLSVNVAMDLSPFRLINPCGYTGLQMTQLKDLGIDKTPDQIRDQLLTGLLMRICKRT